MISVPRIVRKKGEEVEMVRWLAMKCRLADGMGGGRSLNGRGEPEYLTKHYIMR